MDREKKTFLAEEFFQMAMRGALQRSRTYKKGTSDRDRGQLRQSLKDALRDVATRHTQTVSEGEHYRRLTDIADTLTDAHAKILLGNRMRIGVVQKAVNLYLKYLWCVGAIHMPPHCPFDNVVIRALRSAGGYAGLDWTRLTSIDEYKALVVACRRAAGGVALAEWELRIFNTNRP